MPSKFPTVTTGRSSDPAAAALPCQTFTRVPRTRSGRATPGLSRESRMLAVSAAKRRAQRAAGERSRKGGLAVGKASKVEHRTGLLAFGGADPVPLLRPELSHLLRRDRRGRDARDRDRRDDGELRTRVRLRPRRLRRGVVSLPAPP